MQEKLTTEQFFSQLRGSMDLVVEACALVIAEHPDKGRLLGQLSSLGSQITENDSDQEKHYKFGVLRSIASIAKRVGNLDAQEEVSKIDPADRH